MLYQLWARNLVNEDSEREVSFSPFETVCGLAVLFLKVSCWHMLNDSYIEKKMSEIKDPQSLGKSISIKKDGIVKKIRFLLLEIKKEVQWDGRLQCTGGGVKLSKKHLWAFLQVAKSTIAHRQNIFVPSVGKDVRFAPHHGTIDDRFWRQVARKYKGQNALDLTRKYLLKLTSKLNIPSDFIRWITANRYAHLTNKIKLLTIEMSLRQEDGSKHSVDDNKVYFEGRCVDFYQLPSEPFCVRLDKIGIVFDICHPDSEERLRDYSSVKISKRQINEALSESQVNFPKANPLSQKSIEWLLLVNEAFFRLISERLLREYAAIFAAGFNLNQTMAIIAQRSNHYFC